MRIVGALRPAIRPSLAGEGVEAVGVDHQRRLDRGGSLASQLDRAGIAAHPGPEHPGRGALEGAQDRLQRGRRQAAVAAGAADRHHLRLPRLEDRLQLGRHGHRRVAGPRPDRRQRGHPHGAGEPARAAGDRHLPRAELRRPGAAARRQRQHSRLDRPSHRLTGRAAGDPDRRHPQLSRVPLARRDPVPELRRVEADGQVRFDREPGDLARRCIDPRGDVAGDDRRATAVDRLDRRHSGLTRRAGKAGAEDRVDHGARTLEPPLEVAGNLSREELQHFDLVAHPRQMPRRNQPVAAVVALAAENPHGPVRRQLGDGLGQRRPGRLHQLRLGNPLLLDRPAVDRPHPLGVIQRAQPRLHSGSLDDGDRGRKVARVRERNRDPLATGRLGRPTGEEHAAARRRRPRSRAGRSRRRGRGP